MNSLAEDIKTWLEDTGESSSLDIADWPIYKVGLPDEPDQAIGIIDVGGEGVLSLLDGTDVERPECQILARARDYESPRQKLEDIREVLHRKSSVDEGGASYWFVVESSSISPVEPHPDKEGRFVWTVYYKAWRNE